MYEVGRGGGGERNTPGGGGGEGVGWRVDGLLG